jgi:predicted DNA-binding transcriptional regulator AlpA
MKNSIQIIRSTELSKLLGVSKTTIWRWRQKSDFGFPNPLYFGSRIVGWKLEDIHAWLSTLQEA